MYDITNTALIGNCPAAATREHSGTSGIINDSASGSGQASSIYFANQSTTTGPVHGLFDRQYDAANHRYGYSLATETTAGALLFATAQLTTALSDPTTGNRWCAATVNPAFPFATTFLGDYSNIAAMPSGGIVAYWTDLRETACFAGRCGQGQDAFFAAAP
jgi:hypothetical protein